MLIKKEKRQRVEATSQCISYEYPFDDQDIDVAFIEIQGRYPDKGYALNELVKEMIFVTHGKGEMIIEEDEYLLQEGDAVLILPKKKYFFEGDLKLVISCNPTWTQEQHKHLEIVK